jgi:hypothetical protein
VVHAGVFINYRGEDSYSYGALLHSELCRHFGQELVFLDSESIPAGADYAEQLLERVRQAHVVLAVISTRWLAAAGPGGRRIDDPADWTRRELVEAFAAGVRVIPVLTDEAQLPTEAQLPEDLRALGRCQFRRLRHRDASADVARLWRSWPRRTRIWGWPSAAAPTPRRSWPARTRGWWPSAPRTRRSSGAARSSSRPCCPGLLRRSAAAAGRWW